jgi:hypothetical protein
MVGWYAPLMQYESFYLRSAKHEPNAFNGSTRSKKRPLLSKELAESSENPETTKLYSLVWEFGGSGFLSSSCPHNAKKGLLCGAEDQLK